MIKSMPKGFTIIEIIVVLSIIGLISSLLILFNKIGSAQIDLSIEQIYLIQALNRSKSLAIATYVSQGAPCGYGLKINYDQSSYALFKYGLSSNPQFCQNITSSSIDISDSTYAEIEKRHLSQNILFKKGTDYVNAIFFIPPDPQTLIWKSEATIPIKEGSLNPNAHIYLINKNGSLEKSIKINVAGQITF